MKIRAEEMAAEEWKPGSFTKNFSWGPPEHGLLQLHEIIRLGFDNKIEDVPRTDFRQRVESSTRPDYIPLNFFLFNKNRNGQDFIVADELVFQAITSDHSPRFDKLALFAFNFSYVGRWKGAAPDQRRPALWAFNYIIDRVVGRYNWNTSSISADDIENYVRSDRRYIGKTTRKLATNLNYLYSIGRLSEFSDSSVERWWVDALFLALDRLIENRSLDGLTTPEFQYAGLLRQSQFRVVSGSPSLEKDLATKHLLSLYIACGGRNRFSNEHVENLTALSLPDAAWLIANDNRPRGAVHPTNPHILKSIPWACAMLARYVGFDVITADELEVFDAETFVRERTLRALQTLREKNVSPTMSVEDLMKLTREK